MTKWFAQRIACLTMAASSSTAALYAAKPNCAVPPPIDTPPFAYYQTQWRPFPYLEMEPPIAIVPPIELLPQTPALSKPKLIEPLPEPKKMLEPIEPPKNLQRPSEIPLKLPESSSQSSPEPNLNSDVRAGSDDNKILPPEFVPDSQPMAQQRPAASITPETVDREPDAVSFLPVMGVVPSENNELIQSSGNSVASPLPPENDEVKVPTAANMMDVKIAATENIILNLPLPKSEIGALTKIASDEFVPVLLANEKEIEFAEPPSELSPAAAPVTSTPRAWLEVPVPVANVFSRSAVVNSAKWTVGGGQPEK